MRTLRDVLKAVPASPETGLPTEGVGQSRLLFGANRLTPLPREPLWKKFLEKFNEPIIKILLAAAALSVLVDLFKLLTGGAGQGHPSVEGLAVMVAVVLATGVAFVSEYKSDREFEVLNARKDALQVKVLRAGAFHTIPLEEVLVGDAVVLETGDEIPADGRLLKATEMYVDQALMTGESEPVRKQPGPDGDTSDGPEQPGCLYRGTQVVDGVGKMLVTEVGDATYLGQIARRLSAEDDEDEEDEAAAAETQEKRVKKKLTISKEMTPLQLKLTNLA